MKTLTIALFLTTATFAQPTINNEPTTLKIWAVNQAYYNATVTVRSNGGEISGKIGSISNPKEVIPVLSLSSPGI